MSPTATTIKNNIRLAIIFVLGFGSLVIGSIGARWTIGGVAMAPLTVVVCEVLGLAILLLAWRDLDRESLSPFFTQIGVAFTIELTHAHEPEADALLQGTLTVEQALVLSDKMLTRSKDFSSEITDRERKLAALVPPLIDVWIEIQDAPKKQS